MSKNCHFQIFRGSEFDFDELLNFLKAVFRAPRIAIKGRFWTFTYLISRKIWVTEKSWNIHIVCHSQCKIANQLAQVCWLENEFNFDNFALKLMYLLERILAFQSFHILTVVQLASDRKRSISKHLLAIHYYSVFMQTCGGGESTNTQFSGTSRQ